MSRLSATAQGSSRCRRRRRQRRVRNRSTTVDTRKGRWVLRGGERSRDTAMKIRFTIHLLSAVALSVVLGAVPSPSPVADAAMKGDRDAVRALLKQGADVSAAQGDGMTALHWAADRGDAATAEMLIYAGANVTA